MNRWIYLLVALLLPSLSSLRAEGEEKLLRWGGDAQGGAPYVFQDPEDPTILKGFEVDLIEAIAKRMGRKPVFVQNEWSGLIPGLDRGDYDIALSGQEITPEHEENFIFTKPYYITGAQLVVGRSNTVIEDLKDCGGKKIGSLKESEATRILRAAGNIEVVSYEDEVNAFNDTVLGRMDGAMVDQPVAVFYGLINPGLKSVGKLAGRIEYGMAANQKQQALVEEINRALDEVIASGEFRTIFERWNLWNALLAEHIGATDVASQSAPTEFDAWCELQKRSLTWVDKMNRYISFIPILLNGAWTTLWLSVISMSLAVALGLVLAVVRIYAPKPISLLAMIYIEVVRGTPLLIQLFLIFYGLPLLGLNLTPPLAAFIGLGLNYAAYEAENYRAGLMSVSKGQLEAALSLGMTRGQGLRHVVVPQAVRLVIPPVTNDFISLLKDSSLVSVITMVELTKIYSQLAQTYFDYLGIGLMTAVVYLLLGLPFVRLASWFESHLHVDARGNGQRPGMMPAPAASK